jgi:rhomboid-related protein 1/2/3
MPSPEKSPYSTQAGAYGGGSFGDTPPVSPGRDIALRVNSPDDKQQKLDPSSPSSGSTSPGPKLDGSAERSRENGEQTEQLERQGNSFSDLTFREMLYACLMEFLMYIAAWFGGRQFLHGVLAEDAEAKKEPEGADSQTQSNMLRRLPTATQSLMLNFKGPPKRRSRRFIRFSLRQAEYEEVTIQPGASGIRGDRATGVVEEVTPGGQCAQAGVKEGWQIVQLDGLAYTPDLLSAKRRGRSPYVVKFVQDAVQTVTFKPGRLGLVGNWTAGGDVVEVTKGGQAAKAGVQVGWKFLKLDRELFEEELLDGKKESNSPYTITFLKKAGADAQGHAIWNEQMDWPFQAIPIVCIIEVIASFVVHIGWPHAEMLWASLELHGWHCEDYRGEVWRWFTYQFVHGDWSHILCNIVALIFLGIPVEGHQGNLRTFIMFNVGVLGGGAGHIVVRPHERLVGFSGGLFALLGIHITDLFLNWDTSIYRLPKCAMLTWITVLIWIPAFVEEDPVTSHSAHTGGFIAGMCIGFILGRNDKLTYLERFLRWLFFLLGAILVMAVIFWYFLWPPVSLFDGEWTQWCWAAGVHNKTFFGNNDWNCVACYNASCIDKWESLTDPEFLQDTHSAVAHECGIKQAWAWGRTGTESGLIWAWNHD